MKNRLRFCRGNNELSRKTERDSWHAWGGKGTLEIGSVHKEDKGDGGYCDQGWNGEGENAHARGGHP